MFVQAMAFIHGHQHAKHSVNMQQMLRRLRWDRLEGYHDLNRVCSQQPAPPPPLWQLSDWFITACQLLCMTLPGVLMATPPVATQ